MIENGSDLNQKDRNKQTPLQFAKKLRNEELVSAIKEAVKKKLQNSMKKDEGTDHRARFSFLRR